MMIIYIYIKVELYCFKHREISEPDPQQTIVQNMLRPSSITLHSCYMSLVLVYWLTDKYIKNLNLSIKS